jgi:2-methylcitrate dehydratase PrpD
VHLKDGRKISGRADFAKGHPSNPMSYDETADKFRGSAEFAKWPRGKIDSIVQIVRDLDNSANVARLSAALTV